MIELLVITEPYQIHCVNLYENKTVLDFINKNNLKFYKISHIRNKEGIWKEFIKEK